MRKIIALLAIACTVGMTSCKKEFQRYEGPTQIRFEKTSYSFNVTAETATVTIPIQLVSTENQPEIVANIAVDAKSTAAAAVTVPTSVKIDAGRYVSNVVINVNYAALVAATKENPTPNKVVLNLTSGIKVAENFKTTTITLVKK